MTICLIDITDYRVYYHEPSFVRINKFGSLKIDSREPLDVNIFDAKAVNKLIQKRKSFTLEIDKTLEYSLARTWRIKLWLTLYGIY